MKSEERRVKNPIVGKEHFFLGVQKFAGVAGVIDTLPPPYGYSLYLRGRVLVTSIRHVPLMSDSRLLASTDSKL